MNKKLEIYAELGSVLQLVIEDREELITWDFKTKHKDSPLSSAPVLMVAAGPSLDKNKEVF